MSKRNLIITIGGLAVVAIGWAVFRPELLFVNKAVNETFPGEASSAGAATVASGNFYGVAHETEGTATIYRNTDGKRTLRFTNFTTSNGPDVQVFLAKAGAPMDNDEVRDGGYVSLGSIKGNQGDQNYELPADIDLNQYHSVVIWCNRFGVNFGAASLSNTSAEPMILSQGVFHGVAHETTGRATVYQLADGRKVLRLSDFVTSNGPDVRVFLASAKDASDNAAVTDGGYVSLGSIKGNEGDQNYDIAADVDLERYHSVIIWCNRFGVNFGTAPLTDNLTMSTLN